jgi:hypothetical protein
MSIADYRTDAMKKTCSFNDLARGMGAVVFCVAYAWDTGALRVQKSERRWAERRGGSG